MKFTVKGKKVDSEIKKQLDIVCKEILANLKNVRSIILAGSFAYGQGPVKVKKGKVYPYNDYDIYVVTDYKVKDEKVDELATKTANSLGLVGISYFNDFKKEFQKLEKNFYVDLKCLTTSDLKKLLPRSRFYSLKRASMILYGEDIRFLIPDYKLSDIPLSEPAKFLLDRMSQLIEYYSTKKNYDPEILTYLIQQAYAACMSSLLFLSQNYKTSYYNSMKVLLKTYKKDFPSLYKKLSDLPLRIKKFIEWRLDPAKIPVKDIEKAWLIAANDIYEVSKYFFEKWLGKEIKDLDDLVRQITAMSCKFYKPYIKAKFKLPGFLIDLLFPVMACYLKYKYFIRVKQMTNRSYYRVFFNLRSPDAYIFAAVPLLMLAVTKQGIDNEKLEKAVKILRKVYPVTGKNWEEISLDYANAYINFFLQKIG